MEMAVHLERRAVAPSEQMETLPSRIFRRKLRQNALHGYTSCLLRCRSSGAALKKFLETSRIRTLRPRAARICKLSRGYEVCRIRRNVSKVTSGWKQKRTGKWMVPIPIFVYPTNSNLNVPIVRINSCAPKGYSITAYGNNESTQMKTVTR